MIKPNFSNRRLAKVKFFIVYTISVLLIVIVLSSFFKSGNAAVTSVPQENDNSRMAAVNEVLHGRLHSLQAATVFYLENGRPPEGLAAVERERLVFQSAIDSIRKGMTDISNTREKAAVLGLLSSFTTSADNQSRLARSPALPAGGSQAAVDPNSGAEVAGLKQMLADKQSQITALEKQIQEAVQEKNDALASMQNRPVAQPDNAASDDAAAEWKEKYNRLKSSADKSSSQLEALKSSYQQVVEDNRRLITQLQAARAGKN
jgi:hypothetical protein